MKISKKVRIIMWVALVAFIIITSCVIGFAVHRNNQLEAAKPKCDNPTIKGNISLRTGEKIYHLEMDRDYSRTVISPTIGERMFCTEKDAETAGWRHVQQ